MITLQETKIQSMDRKISKDLWGRREFDFVHKPAIGSAGGILVARNKSKVEARDSRVGDYSVSIRCRMKDSEEWPFTGVYGPCDPAAFGLLREDPCKVQVEWKVPWCVGSDFNAIRCPAERLGARRMTRHMRLFNSFLQDLFLMDIP